jgi:phage-related protein
VAGSPGGKSVGRVTIRVIPDTSEFRKDLRQKLAVIEKNTTMTVTVDKVRINTAKVRESIREQMASLTNVAADVDVKAVIDKVTVKRTEVRKSIQEQFDEMGLRVKVTAEVKNSEEFKKQVKDMVEDASNRKVRIEANAATSGARASLAYLARDRIVTLIPQLSKSAVATVATQLAALSGARLAFNWIDDIREFLSTLDKSLPKIGLLTSGIGTLVAVLLSATSGLVGIGAGLASIAPAFLVLPGMILGTAFAITTFVVAMKDAKAQLDPLADSMNELATIIKSDFWAEARDPIIDLVTTLMPQLRVGFSEIARSLGGFSGAMADAFKQELAGGKLVSLFGAIAKSFDILSTGAKAFAGALVSLSAIAAQYVPRLATWFVDIANTFDAWLKATAEDGRMSEWIETAITGIKDLGRVVLGVSGIFSALWKAAEAAGGGGLGGFADNLQRISDIMNGPVFQSTMTTFFAAAGDAAGYIADSLSAVGDMLVYLAGPLALLLSTTGEILGQFITDVAGALSSPEVAGGITDFIFGLREGFAAFGDSLPAIMPALATILGLAGSLAATLGPVLGEVLAALAPAFTTIVEAIEPLIPLFGETLVELVLALAPLLVELAESLAPLIPLLGEELVKAATDLIPPFIELVEAILPILPPLIDAVTKLIPDLMAAFNLLWPVVSTVIDWLSGLIGWMLTPTDEAFNNIADAVASFGPVGEFFGNVIRIMGDLLREGLSGMIARVTNFAGSIGNAWSILWNGALTLVSGIWGGIGNAIQTGIGVMMGLVNSLPASVKGALAGAANWLVSTGSDIINGLVKGITDGVNRAVNAVRNMGNKIVEAARNVLDIHSPSRVMRFKIGRQIPAGVALGIRDGMGDVEAEMAHMVSMPNLGGFSPDLSSLSGGAGATNSTYNATFALAPTPGVPLADQVFAASQRLKARAR